MKKYFTLIFLITLLTSCNALYYIEPDYDIVPTIVVEKEMHTELNPVTEIFFGYHSTTVVYTLAVEYEGTILIFNVDKKEYFSHQVGDTYWAKMIK